MINASVLEIVAASAAAVSRLTACVADNRCRPVASGSCSHQSTSHIAAMTSLRAGAMICLRPDNGRDVEQWPRRHRQPGAASITSTLMIVIALVFITCDTGQPPLHLYSRSQTALPFSIFGRHFNKYKPIPTKFSTHRGHLERTFEQDQCRGASESKIILFPPTAYMKAPLSATCNARRLYERSRS